MVLKSIIVNLIEVLEQKIYPALDRAMVFSRLSPVDKGSYYLAECPRCQKREAFIYKDGFSINCNRLNNCGYSESILQFVANSHNVRGHAFIEAVKSLASMVHVEIAFNDMSVANNEALGLEERKNQILEAIIRFARTALEEKKGHAASYLASRGLAKDTIERFDVGFLAKGFQSALIEHLKRLDFQSEEIEGSGILADARWEERIIGAWRTKGRRIQTLWARSIDDDHEPRYLYLKNNKKDGLFGVDKAIGNELIAVEGLFDMMSLWQAGLRNVVALGGASISSSQLEFLGQSRLKSLTLNLDYDPKDKNLHKAKECAQKLLKSSCDSYFIDPAAMAKTELHSKIDPDKYIRGHSLQEYQELVNKAVGTSKFLAKISLDSLDLSSDRSVDRVIDELIEIEGKVDSARASDIWLLAQLRTGFSAEHLQTKRAQRMKGRLLQHRTHELESALRHSIEELKKQPVGQTLNTLALTIERFKVDESRDSLEPFSVDSCLRNIKNAQSGKKTGWPPLDDIGIRLMPAELTIIGGRTGHGKTTALFSLLLNWLLAESDEHFLLFSYELPKEAICLKLASTLSRHISEQAWSYNEIVDCLQDRERAQHFPPIATLEQALDKLRNFERRLHVVYKPRWDVDELCAHANSVALKIPLGAILVDYLQLIPPPNERIERRDLEVSLVSRRLKSLSVALSCPVVAAAQIGRQAVADSGRIPHDKGLQNEIVLDAIKKRRPQLHHLREGGSEQEADLILGLLNYQADFMENCETTTLTAPQATPFEINVIKNRFGRLCIGSLALEARCGFIRKKGYRD